MQLSAVEDMLRGGVDRPRRTLILAYGADEEVGGRNGARRIAESLARRFPARKHADRPFVFIMDEGAMILRGALPGVGRTPVAMICNAEKGAVNVALRVTSACAAGHSSSPPTESNVGVLARAVSRLESSPFPAQPASFFETLAFAGPLMPLALRIVVANAWLFGPVIERIALATPKTAPLVRTTTACTVLRAGNKINVVPGEAVAFVNHRIHPADADAVRGCSRVLDRDRSVIGDERVELEQFSFGGGGTRVPGSSPDGGWTPPSPVSPLSGLGFDSIVETVAEVFGAPAAPMVMTGNTDTRWYWGLSDCIYRFSPIVLDLEDVGMFHGVDERVSTKNLAALRAFYESLVRRTCL
jgi:carboxypeptidase PM20D1